MYVREIIDKRTGKRYAYIETALDCVLLGEVLKIPEFSVLDAARSGVSKAFNKKVV